MPARASISTNDSCENIKEKDRDGGFFRPALLPTRSRGSTTNGDREQRCLFGVDEATAATATAAAAAAAAAENDDLAIQQRIAQHQVANLALAILSDLDNANLGGGCRLQRHVHQILNEAATTSRRWSSRYSYNSTSRAVTTTTPTTTTTSTSRAGLMRSDLRPGIRRPLSPFRRSKKLFYLASRIKDGQDRVAARGKEVVAPLVELLLRLKSRKALTSRLVSLLRATGITSAAI